MKVFGAAFGTLIGLLILLWAYHIPAQLISSALVLFLIAVLPGILLGGLFADTLKGSRLTTLSFTAGPIICYAVFKLLASLSLWQFTAIIMLGIDAVLVMLLLFRLKSACWEFLRRTSSEFIIALFFALVFVLIFAAPNFHFASNGDLLTRGYFGIDLPFLAGETASLKNFGLLRDLHQAGRLWYYHDLAYTIIAAASGLIDSNVLLDVAFAAPIVFLSILLVTVHNAVRMLTDSRVAAGSVALLLFLSSGFIASDALPLLLSPSYVLGLVMFFGLLSLLNDLLDDSRTGISSAVFLSVLLSALAVTKLTTFASAMALVLIAAAVALLNRRIAVAGKLTAVAVAALGFLVVTSHANPLQPTGDFVVGAPLLGYANHLSALLHTSAVSMNPVAGPESVGLRQLWILPFFLFHLVRFLLSDPRAIAVILALIFLRKRLPLFLLRIPNRMFLLSLLLTIPTAYLLPVLYSPRWYPLALSFYGPLMGNVILALVAGMMVTTFGKQWNRAAQAAAAVLLLVSLLSGIVQLLPKGPVYTALSAKRAALLQSLNVRSRPSDLVASFRTDYDLRDAPTDESFYLYSAISERPVISAGAAYGSLLAALPTTDSLKQIHRVAMAAETLERTRATLDTLLLSDDEATIGAAARQAHIRFILWDDINDPAPRTPFARYAELLSVQDHLHLYHVRE